MQSLRIGIDRDWVFQDIDTSVQRVLTNAAEVMLQLGAEIVDVQVPDMAQAVADWTPLCAVEAAVAHEPTYPARRQEYGPVLASVLESGRALSALDYHKILLRRVELRRRFATLFQGIDLLLAPVHPYAPLRLTEISTLGHQPELILKLQRYTAPFNMADLPTITVPGGFTEAGLPVGFQFVAPRLGEMTLIRAGMAYQSATDFHSRHPPG